MIINDLSGAHGVMAKITTVGRSRRDRLARFGMKFTASVLVAVLAGCESEHSSMLHPHGIVAQNQRYWLVYICAFMAIVVVPIFVMMPLFAWRYRLGGRAAYKPDWDFSWTLEVLVWGVPIVIVCFLAALIINQETRFDPYRPIASREKPLEIDVVALNWKWLFLYPDQHVASLGTMAFPADRPVTFRLTSDKTIQSFFIPALGSQIYAMGGMVTQLNLMADGPGRFIGENTQFNGMEFQRDRFVARGMTTADFARWTASARAAGRALDLPAFRKLAADGTVNDAISRFGGDPQAGDNPIPELEPGLQFSGYDPKLFADVVARFDAGAAEASAASGGSGPVAPPDAMPGMSAPSPPTTN